MRTHARSGFTVAELVIALLVITIMGGGIALVLKGTSEAYEAVSISVHNDAKARRAMRKVKHILRWTEASMAEPITAPGLWSESLEFQTISGTTAGVPTWGELQRLEAILDPAELDDGVDNDGDGLVDERHLVWTRNVGAANERRTILSRAVARLAAGELENGIDDNGNDLADEPGACFSYAAGTATFRLTVEQAHDTGEVVQATYTTTSRMRGMED